MSASRNATAVATQSAAGYFKTMVKDDPVSELRGKAEHWRELARQVLDSAVKKTLLEAANDYEQQAFRLERNAELNR